MQFIDELFAQDVYIRAWFVRSSVLFRLFAAQLMLVYIQCLTITAYT